MFSSSAVDDVKQSIFLAGWGKWGFGKLSKKVLQEKSEEIKLVWFTINL